MPIPIDRIRADTPGLPDTTHLIASGAGLMPQPVVAAVTAHLNLEADIGGYEAHAVKAVELDGVYASVARLPKRLRSWRMPQSPGATRSMPYP